MTTPLRRDHAGSPVRVPPRSTLTYDQFADAVDALTPTCCAFPSGQRIDPATKMPCRREKLTDDGCELHTARKAGKSLRYGKHLPKAVRQKFLQAATDQQLLNIGHDVALVSARLHELSARLDTGESGKAWEDLQEAWTDFVAAQSQVKQAAAMGDEKLQAKWAGVSLDCMQRIGKLIKSGNENELTWKEIIQCSSLLANLKGQETRRMREAGEVLSIEQAMLLVQKLQDVIFSAVKDVSTRTRIATDLALLVGVAGVRSKHGAEGLPASNTPPAIEHKPQVSAGLRLEDYLGEG